MRFLFLFMGLLCAEISYGQIIEYSLTQLQPGLNRAGANVGYSTSRRRNQNFETNYDDTETRTQINFETSYGKMMSESLEFGVCAGFSNQDYRQLSSVGDISSKSNYKTLFRRIIRQKLLPVFSVYGCICRSFLAIYPHEKQYNINKRKFRC